MLKPGGYYLFVEHVAAKGIELNFLIHRQERKLLQLTEWEFFNFFFLPFIVVVVQMEQFLD